MLALVLTYNAPGNALECVASLNRQTVLPSSILVVENAGRERLSADELRHASSLPVELVALTSNLGPAGGYAEGLRRAAASTFDTVWIMDDDIKPDPDCLERLLEALTARDSRAVVLPETADSVTGEHASTWGWCAALLPRQLVATIGLPITELFYGFEDHEYLIDRAQDAGYPLVRERSARARLGRRPGRARPVWHYYYLARNATYVYLYRKRGVAWVLRLKRLAHFHWRLVRTVFVHQSDHRARRLWLYGRGVLDGLLRRLGPRVAPTDDRRPAFEGVADPGPHDPLARPG